MSDSTLDYVVIGGGAAGLVVGSRLTEDSNTSVLILEAGQDFTNAREIMVPGLSWGNMGREDMHWFFNTVPQPAANNRAIFAPRGKALGGSTTVNHGLITRGHAAEFDAFEQLGNKGWNWKSFLEYHKKSETYTVSPEQSAKFGVKVNPETHGTSGPIHRTLPLWTPESRPILFEALKSLGVPYNTDPASGDNVGGFSGHHGIHEKDVVRSAAAAAYLEPNKSRKNLNVTIGAEVARILIEKDASGKPVAKGVEYRKDGQILKAYAKKEVLVCAGTMKTPQLLELSGIGDKKILESLGVPTVVDLPGVGANLQDHYWCSYTAEIRPDIETKDILLADPARVGKELEAYDTSKTGMFTVSASSDFGFFPPTYFMEKDALEKLAQKSTPSGNAGIAKTLQIQKEWLVSGRIPHMEIALVPSFMPATGKQAEPGKRYISFLIALQHSFARGTVHAGSADPYADPVINPHLLEDGIDLEIMVQSIKYMRKIMATEAFRGVLVKEINPGEEVQSDEDLKALIRNSMQSVYHVVGTASMLPREDGGVVDSTLKVYGVEQLRVIDASVIPIHISGHPQSAVYALAERAADIIKGTA